MAVRIALSHAGAHVEIVSRMHRPLATLRHEDAEMGLIRTFVVTETRVAIDAVGTVFDFQGSDVGVELPDGRYQCFAKGIPAGLYLLIPLFVGHKPFPVVVARKVAQELQCFSHFVVVDTVNVVLSAC